MDRTCLQIADHNYICKTMKFRIWHTSCEFGSASETLERSKQPWRGSHLTQPHNRLGTNPFLEPEVARTSRQQRHHHHLPMSIWQNTRCCKTFPLNQNSLLKHQTPQLVLACEGCFVHLGCAHLATFPRKTFDLHSLSLITCSWKVAYNHFIVMKPSRPASSKWFPSMDFKGDLGPLRWIRGHVHEPGLPFSTSCTPLVFTKPSASTSTATNRTNKPAPKNHCFIMVIQMRENYRKGAWWLSKMRGCPIRNGPTMRVGLGEHAHDHNPHMILSLMVMVQQDDAKTIR
ncbi:hypothetical protein Ahy_A08g037522 isoform C [Arachis hypogaea]|uniref:Uncharacterized protein n=1 Tax=Arachis hypogaea TaxID=3818 RepID=A0A445BR11_ARAHY|nr:hypothetical protein Ahy_A08g037522 isoform C [Arachis hypogaea]